MFCSLTESRVSKNSNFQFSICIDHMWSVYYYHSSIINNHNNRRKLRIGHIFCIIYKIKPFTKLKAFFFFESPSVFFSSGLYSQQWFITQKTPNKKLNWNCWYFCACVFILSKYSIDIEIDYLDEFGSFSCVCLGNITVFQQCFH